MKARIITTITTLVDLDTMTPEHSVDINDEDGLSEASSELMGAVLIGGLRSVERAVREQFHVREASGTPITEDEA